jgi:lysophospholipase
MSSLKEACDRGVVIVAISQCAKGSVSDAYETGRTLLQVGVVPGGDMTPECALTKLSYLLSKPELSPSDIRNLMGIPLRGELTRPSGSAPTQPTTINQSLENIKGLLSQFVRLSNSAAPIPQVVVTANLMDEVAQDAAKPWTWTAAEAVSTEAALVPFLVHLAAARDDVESLKLCLSPANSEAPVLGETQQYGAIARGIVNCLDAASGRSALHVAALNGSTRCIGILLESGALVHLRDSLGHTPLYYVSSLLLII